MYELNINFLIRFSKNVSLFLFVRTEYEISGLRHYVVEGYEKYTTQFYRKDTSWVKLRFLDRPFELKGWKFFV